MFLFFLKFNFFFLLQKRGSAKIFIFYFKQGLFGTFDFTPFFDSYGWLALVTIAFISFKVPNYWLITPSYWISTRIKFQKWFSRMLKLNFGLHGKPITIRFIFNIFSFILLANYLGMFWRGFSIFGHLLIPSLILVCLPLFLRIFNPRRFRSFICPEGSPLVSLFYSPTLSREKDPYH